MAVRIDRIKVNRGGPLDRDFELEAGDLNLVYGHNETGKTYIVETMINLLFRTGSRSPAKWNLREWDLGGRIIISGLKDDPVTFTKTGKKLEDFWEEGAGLPGDLSRLLVVKAGGTVLTGEAGDGVGRDILKEYLSGVGLLDNIAERISTTVQGATLQDRRIDGARRGELKTRIQCMEELKRLNDLLSDVKEDYAAGEVYSLRKEKEAIEVELEGLQKAKRYRAAELHEDIQALYREKDRLPAEEELAKLESDIRFYEGKREEYKTKSANLKELEGTSDDYKWAEAALNGYQEIISGKALSGPTPVLVLMALLFLAGAVIAGFLGLNVPLVICGTGSLLFFIIYYVRTRNVLARSGVRAELENLKAEFSSRFGSELTSMAALQAQLDKLRDAHSRSKSLREDVNNLTLEINSSQSRITEILKTYTGTQPSPREWRDALKELRAANREHENKIRSLETKFASLDVREEDFIEQYPGTEWDPERYETLKETLDETKEALRNEEEKLEHLKTRIAQQTGSESTGWEELITELVGKREQAVEEYKEITADILAKIQVNSTIQELRKEENTRIADGLKREELTGPLHALTGRYGRIRQKEDASGLVLFTDQDEEYHLADISTGAREQIFLALRMGFASMAMKGQPGFLILDDAFQHSDWGHRKNLIAETLKLVETGWQVFYFAMDDHIRDLFLKEGRTLGERFRSVELC